MDLIAQLEQHDDKALHSHLRYGVHYSAELVLQLCFMPHLLSLSTGFASVQSELARLAKLGWYEVFTRIPIWPSLMHGQGATARKLTSNARRTSEYGQPGRDPCRPARSACGVSTPRWLMPRSNAGNLPKPG